MSEYGHVDILVNNAGGGRPGAIVDYSDEDWRASLALDLDGVFFCMREFGREMVKAGYGRIINIASILGKGGLPELPVADYATAKGGVINLTRQAAAEWATTGVTVNALCPGSSLRRQTARGNGGDGWLHQGPHAHGSPWPRGELDSSIVYLAADESTYVTGSIISPATVAGPASNGVSHAWRASQRFAPNDLPARPCLPRLRFVRQARQADPGIPHTRHPTSSRSHPCTKGRRRLEPSGLPCPARTLLPCHSPMTSRQQTP